MTEIKNAVFAGLAFGLFITIFFGFISGFGHALIIGPFAAILFGLSIYAFTTSKIVRRQTGIQANGEGIIYSGGANHFKNGEAVGGKLHLLEDKLIFMSHGFNIQNHEIAIDIGDIADIKFFNTLGLVPNGFKVVTVGGQVEKFVVGKRRVWQEKIKSLTSGT